jgi:hypothetical protein
MLTIKGEKLDKYRMRNRDMENANKIMIQACEVSINGFLKDLDGKADNVYLEVAYSGVDKTPALEFVEEIKKVFPGKNVDAYPLCLSVSCHIGTGALAMGISKAIPELEK